jgi:hypothetical protein
MQTQEKQQIEQAIAKAMQMDMSHYDDTDEWNFSGGFYSGVSWVRSLIEKETGTRLDVLHLLAEESKA